MARESSSVMRRRLNAMPALGADYDERLSQYLDANSRRFRIAVPAGEWWVAYEHPGYLAWYGEPETEGIAAGIGSEDPHVVMFEIQEVMALVDLGSQLTGDLERDASLYQATIRKLMLEHAELVTEAFGSAWVPSRHAWGIPRASR